MFQQNIFCNNVGSWVNSNFIWCSIMANSVFDYDADKSEQFNVIRDFSHLLYHTKFPIYTRLAKPVTGRGSCTPNSFRGSTGLSRGLNLTEYEALYMEYKVLACLLNDIPITTVWYEISHFDQASFACCWSCKPFFFAGQLVYPWGPHPLNRIYSYGAQVWNTGC